MNDLNVQEQLAKTEDKILELQEEIAQTQQGLLALTMELEQRVDDRTAELRAAHAELENTNSELLQLTFELEDRVSARTADLIKANEALRENEERFRATFEQAAVGIAQVSPDGRWLQANQRLCDIVGYTHEELRAKSFQDITHPDDVNVDANSMHQLLAGETKTYLTEKRYIRKDGSTVWINLTVGLVRKADGTPHYFISVIEDINQRKEAEEALRRHRDELELRVRERTAQLETANKELEAFAYSVSHDLRAPLRGLDGFSAALLSQYAEKLDEQARHYLERIQAASRRMGQLIDDLLNLSRLSRRELIRREVDLSALARQIAAELQAQEPERLAEFTIAEGMTCEGDAHLLRVALENLMGNAWKFTGGRSPARIEVGTAEQDGERVYFVRDNGVGFDMAYADKLFGPFQRLHAAHEFPGTGIGLATVQRILHRHGGRIWPEAAVGRGATFSFTLGGEHDGQNHPAG